MLTYSRSQVCLYGVHLEFNSDFLLKNIYLAASGLGWSTWVLAVVVRGLWSICAQAWLLQGLWAYGILVPQPGLKPTFSAL